MTRRTMIAGVLVLSAVLLGSLAVLQRGRHGKSPSPAHSAGAVQLFRQRGPIDVAEVALDGRLAKGWDDWGWGQHELPDAGVLRVDFGAYGGVILHHDELRETYGALVFRYRASKPYDDLLRVSLKSARVDDKALPQVEVEARHIAMLEDGWYEVMIPWSALNPGGIAFDRIFIQARRFFEHERVELDKVVFTKRGAASSLTASVRSVSLAIHCDQPATRISPLIYGIAGNVWTTNATARRMGGNPATRLNWELGVWNAGNDWFFENGKADHPTVWFDEDIAHGAKGAIVVPMIGWVSKDATSFGFPAAQFGEQKAHDPYKHEAGNGVGKDGKPIAPGPPTQTSVAAPPELIGKWIRDVRESDRKKGVRSIDMYILDNEPNLWNTTHRDVHPDPLSYDELLDRTVRYGKAIREADPDAVIAGPAEWGWTGYFYSAKDQVRGTTLRLDRRAHGDVPLIAWYLQKLKEYETQNGVRLLDVLDVHFYPQVPGNYGNDARTDPESAALRIRSTRALWDPSYKDESWIAEPVRLIPRLKEWVSENYPGRGISIGEWSFGAEGHMSGALAIAETLGRFGQQGILSAFYWLCPEAGTPGFQAFRAFRNFDGKGSAFLDWSVPATEAPGVSVFASRDEGRSRVVAVLLNLQPDTVMDAAIDVSSCGPSFSRQVFEYRDGSPGFSEGKRAGDGASGDELRASGILRERLEPYSIKVLALTALKHPAP